MSQTMISIHVGQSEPPEKLHVTSHGLVGPGEVPTLTLETKGPVNPVLVELFLWGSAEQVIASLDEMIEAAVKLRSTVLGREAKST